MKGRQTPTREYILPYTETDGDEAAQIYEESGRELIPWQKLILADILAKDDDGLWLHQKFGFSVPRRNGKNEVVAAREMYGLETGEYICHTAHRTTTAHTAWVRLVKLLTDAGYVELGRKSKNEVPPDKSFRSSKTYGLESVVLTNGGEINFRTRTSNGGLGEGFDLLVIDEAHEYTDAQEAALIYTVTDSKNPQTIYIGTPPTATSAGTVFLHMRADALSGEAYDTGWAEWSLPNYTEDFRDPDLWYETNPSMGYHLDERKIRSEIKTGKEVDFNIQRLGVWLRYNQKSVITEDIWDELKTDKLPDLTGKMFCGVKYSKVMDTVALSIAVKTKDDRIFVECIDVRPARAGDDWLVAFLRNPSIQEIIIDGAGGQDRLKDELKDARIPVSRIILPRVYDVIKAHSVFETALYKKTVTHMGQESLRNSATNCEKRAIGSAGGWGYRSLIEGLDISLLDSVVLAYYAAAEAKEVKPQQVYY